MSKETQTFQKTILKNMLDTYLEKISLDLKVYQNISYLYMNC